MGAEDFKGNYYSEQGGSCVGFYGLALEVTPCPFYSAFIVIRVTKVHLVLREET